MLKLFRRRPAQDKSIATGPRKQGEAVQEVPQAGEVIIVSGLPRSGTSMMMRMLEAGGLPVIVDGVREQDDDNPRGYYEFEPVKKTKEDPSWLDDAPGKVVKMVYRLLYDLPDTHQYRVVFMQRKLEEILASQNVMLERHGKLAENNDDELAAKLFVQEIEAVRKWLQEKGNFEVLYVDYNNMLQDSGPQISSLNEYLGGELDALAMAQVVEPTLYRNRR